MSDRTVRWEVLSRFSMLAACAVAACGGGTDEVDASRAVTTAPAPAQGRATAAATASTVVVTARAQLAQNVGAIFALRVNGTVVATQEVRATSYQAYTFSVPAIAAGSQVDIVYTNDYYYSGTGEDRNLYVQSISIDGTTYQSTDRSVMRYDLGAGDLAFDNQNVISARAEILYFGALRFTTTAGVASSPAPAPAPTPTPAPAPAPANAPVIVNGPASARPGDIVGLQGENFGTAPVVWLDATGSSAAVQMPVLNRVGTNWIAVQIPGSATGALSVRVVNNGVTSAAIKLNAARADHLDALQIVPGTVFRIFGRNLLVANATPRVTVGGIAATVNTAASNEHMLVVTAPGNAAATSAAAITVDNGNGTGASTLDRKIEVVFSGSGDPFSTGIGWTAGFSGISGRVIQAATDTRLRARVACNGSTNDAPAIQVAVDYAAANGGGVVQLPAGTCRLAGGFGLKSNVVVQGAGKTATVLRYEQDYPFWGSKLDLTGVRNLTLRNAGSAGNGPSLVQSTRALVQNVRFETGTSHQLFFTDNRNFAFIGSDVQQTGSIGEQGPFVMNGSSGVAFLNNTIGFVNGGASFQGVHDAWLQGNRFTRDGSNQWASGMVHTLVMDFTHRVAVIGNSFDVANGPITNHGRNDGETILTEGGGAARTENLGAVATATANTLRDPANSINVNPFGSGSIPENYGVAIVGGKGTGQTRRVTGYANSTLTVDRNWDVIPDTSSRYATFVWGMEKVLIKGNTLSQNPRGIWLYQTAVHDVDILGNTITEGGGIYLRSYQELSSKMFTPIYNIKIQDNRVSNSSRNWASSINSMFINSDARAFGTGLLGIEVRGNQVVTNAPNLSLTSEEYAGVEGYVNMQRVENYSTYETSALPRVLGTIYQRNGCTNCDVAVRLGTGVGGTVISSMSMTNSRTLTTNSTITDRTRETAVSTLLTQ